MFLLGLTLNRPAVLKDFLDGDGSLWQWEAGVRAAKTLPLRQGAGYDAQARAARAVVGPLGGQPAGLHSTAAVSSLCTWGGLWASNLFSLPQFLSCKVASCALKE